MAGSLSGGMPITMAPGDVDDPEYRRCDDQDAREHHADVQPRAARHDDRLAARASGATLVRPVRPTDPSSTERRAHDCSSATSTSSGAEWSLAEGRLATLGVRPRGGAAHRAVGAARPRSARVVAQAVRVRISSPTRTRSSTVSVTSICPIRTRCRSCRSCSVIPRCLLGTIQSPAQRRTAAATRGDRRGGRRLRGPHDGHDRCEPHRVVRHGHRGAAPASCHCRSVEPVRRAAVRPRVDPSAFRPQPPRSSTA